MSRHVFLLSTIVFAVVPIAPSANGQQVAGGAGLVTCSPAPCVLPPSQVSEGGALVNTSPIVSNPLNSKQLLLGSNDWNCPEPSSTGFHTSGDAGAHWNVTCMPLIHTKNYIFWPTGEPLVGYDRNGVAYIAGDYSDSEGIGIGFVGFQSSTDGINWSAPVVALSSDETFAFQTSLAVDTNLSSPFLNTIYISGILIGPPGDQGQNQVVIAHSGDGGRTWMKTPAEPIQNYPANEGFSNLAVGKDGTVYLAWQHCPATGPDAACNNAKGYMLFSKSTDGGNTWSRPRVMTVVTIAPSPCTCYAGILPNTNDVPVYNYPVIGVDNSDGPDAGDIYVAMYSWTGTYMRVGVIRSTDHGTTWSKPVPLAPPSANHDQFFPWLSVSPTGMVGVSWLDRRNDPANVKYQAFAAISRDGGQTFQPNVLLTTAFSDPNVNGFPYNEWMGDHTGNTWIGANFLAAWMDSSNGVDMQEVVGGIRVK